MCLCWSNDADDLCSTTSCSWRLYMVNKATEKFIVVSFPAIQLKNILNVSWTVGCARHIQQLHTTCNTLRFMTRRPQTVHLCWTHVLRAAQWINNNTPCFRPSSATAEGLKILFLVECERKAWVGRARCFPRIRFLSIWSQTGILSDVTDLC